MACLFDERIEREHTDSLKYDFKAARHKPEDVLPFWVADMDFRAPAEVIDALAQSARYGVFGYSDSGADYFAPLHDWYLSRFGWATEPEWLVKTPGVVFAICAAIRALTREGDAVLIQQPVYYPFAQSVRDNNRVLVNNPLREQDGRYSIDFDDLEAKIVRHHVRLFLLCSPHNPVGRVWTKEELARIGAVCARHGVRVVSDEIHGDLVYPGSRQRVFASVSPEFSKLAVVCTSPSKTFNLAGLQNSNIFIPNPEIRRLFLAELDRCGYSQPNLPGLVACRAAYRCGRPWLDKLLEYLAGNVRFTEQFLAAHLPQVRLTPPQGTYLLWLDFRPLGLSEAELENLVVQKARLWLDRGVLFGAEGAGFERINVACPRQVLAEGLARLAQAVSGCAQPAGHAVPEYSSFRA